MKFDLLSTDAGSKARAGTITTDHGKIETPIFMPVGTVASVKGVHQRELKEDINPRCHSRKHLSSLFKTKNRNFKKSRRFA